MVESLGHGASVSNLLMPVTSEEQLMRFKANDLSGVIGAAIVGTFMVILIIYHGGRWVYNRR